MDDNTAAIVCLAWQRMLRLPDGALRAGADRLVVREHPGTIMVVRLWSAWVVVAPGWFLDRTRNLADPKLAEGSRLLAMSVDRGGRLVGEATLAVLDDYIPTAALPSLTVTDDPVAVVDLERACPPDDVAEVGLAEMATALVILDDADRPIAGAGHHEWEHLLAHLGVLTAPPSRGHGVGTAAAALGINRALDDGLVPQWRARRSNLASRQLGGRLGFVEIGSQTTITLPS